MYPFTVAEKLTPQQQKPSEILTGVFSSTTSDDIYFPDGFMKERPSSSIHFHTKVNLFRTVAVASFNRRNAKDRLRPTDF